MTRRELSRLREPAALLSPGLLFLLAAFLFPAFHMLAQSVLTAGSDPGRFTLEHYAKFAPTTSISAWRCAPSACP